MNSAHQFPIAHALEVGFVDAPVTEPDEDTRLVEQALAGDKRAEERLYRKYAQEILDLATRLLRSHDDAADVLHDSFLMALSDLSKLDAPSSFRGWLRKIAVHRVHRRFRRKKLLRVLGLDAGNDAALEMLAATDASGEVRADLAMVDRALLKVSTQERTAWMLRYVEGYDLGAVAEACDCSLATVKRRIAVADARIHEGKGA